MVGAAATLKAWRNDPVLFVRDNFGIEPDDWQKNVLTNFPKKQRIAMKACKGPGKTAVMSWCAWNFLATRPHPKIAATSISYDNLRDGLWTEMAHWRNKSKFLEGAFEWNKERIVATDHPETWFMSARAWSKSADAGQQADTLAGFRADYVMFILDESGGIPDGVMAAAEASLSTGREAKLLQAGNPTHLEGPLWRACTSERHLWHVVEITGDPDDPKRSKRISETWARQQIEKYGRDNPWVLVNVFGKFPPASLNTLLGPDEVQAAMKRHLKENEYEFAQKRLGVDVARFGDDRTVIFPRQGRAAFRPVELRGLGAMDVAARVAQAKAKWGSELELIDGTGGYGAGVVDAMRVSGLRPVEIQFAGKPIDQRYLNKRAEMWFLMAEWIKGGAALPNIPELLRELTAPTYTFTANGKFMLEPKEKIKERLQFSPDMADALALTFGMPEQPAAEAAPWRPSQGQVTTDYDPQERAFGRQAD